MHLLKHLHHTQDGGREGKKTDTGAKVGSPSGVFALALYVALGNLQSPWNPGSEHLTLSLFWLFLFFLPTVREYTLVN